MGFKFGDKNFVCLFPWLTDITAIKCTGQICNTVATKYNLNSYIISYKNDEYLRYKEYCPNVSIKFLGGTLKYSGLKLFIDLVWFIIRQAKKIDILYMYHMSEDYLLIPTVGTIYKFLNKKGVLYIRFEADVSELPFDYPKLKSKSIKDRLKLKNIKYFYNSLDILGISDSISFENAKKRYFWKIAGEKVKLQLNGYSLFNIPCISDFSKKEKVILLAGRLNSYQKGLDVFLKALEKVKLNEWKIILAGDISTKQILEIQGLQNRIKSLNGRIEIVGFVADFSQFSQLINRARLFCLPSRFDGIPLVIPEAMARGCVIVGSDLFGIKKIATNNGECGFYFPNGDSEALANLLTNILQGSYDLEEMSKKSIARAQEIFNWDSIVAGLGLDRFLN